MKQKITTEDFKKALYSLNPNWEVVSEYVNSKTKIKIRCKKCGYEWESIPYDILHSKLQCRNCIKLSGIKIPQKKRYTNEQFIAKLKEVTPNLILLDNYKGCDTSIKFKCLICGEEFLAIPSQIITYKKRCPVCAMKSYREKKGLDPNFVKEQVEITLSKLLNMKLKLLSTYENNRVRMDIVDEITGYKYYYTYERINQAITRNANNMFPFSKFNPYSIYNINLYMEKNNLPWRAFENQKYENERTYLDFYNIYDKDVVILRNLHSIKGTLSLGNGLKNITKVTTETLSETINNLSDGEFELCSEYVNSKIPITMRHKKCGHVFQKYYTHISDGYYSCPHCYEKMSRGEKRIMTLLNERGVTFIDQYKFSDCIYIQPLVYDFYLPELNLAIEYQGQHHYYPVAFGDMTDNVAELNFKKQCIKDNIKRDYCKKNNIKLLEICYKDYTNVEQILMDNGIISSDKKEKMVLYK